MQAQKWLNEEGKITFILPNDAAEKLLEQSQASGLFCQEICKIITKRGQAAKRWIITFTKHSQTRFERDLTVYDENNCYTDEFIQLTQAFYLKM